MINMIPKTAAAARAIFKFNLASKNIIGRAAFWIPPSSGGGSLNFSVPFNSASSAAKIFGTSSLSSVA